MTGQTQFRNGLFCLRLYVKVNNFSVILGRPVLSNQDEVPGKHRTRDLSIKSLTFSQLSYLCPHIDYVIHAHIYASDDQPHIYFIIGASFI